MAKSYTIISKTLGKFWKIRENERERDRERVDNAKLAKRVYYIRTTSMLTLTQSERDRERETEVETKNGTKSAPDSVPHIC